ncbi:MAG: transposase [Thermodesulfobacteriota bacterium]|nr:transposase [Thermodesulfobacteriota bacterium]
MNTIGIFLFRKRCFIKYYLPAPFIAFILYKALVKIFRAKLLKAIVDHNLRVPKSCPEKWVVDCENVGNGDETLIYLGKYLYKGAIQEKDILKCENRMVTFRYLHSNTGKCRTKTASGEYFLWLLMHHVLPKGFRKVRCYRFLHPCSKKLIKLLQGILRFNPIMMVKHLKKLQKTDAYSVDQEWKLFAQ